MESATTIRRQVLDVELRGTELEGHALHRRLPALCAEVLAPALERAFARLDPGDACLYVDRLVIDVPAVALERFESELRDAVAREVADYFRLNLPVKTDADDIRGVGEVRQHTVAEAVDDALLVFLRTGRLPWSFTLVSDSGLEQLVLETWAAGNPDGRPPIRTRALLLEVLLLPSARVRLAMQFTQAFVLSVLQATSPTLATTTDEVVAVLDALPPAPASRAFARQVLIAALAAASARRQLGSCELAAMAWRELLPAQREDRSIGSFIEQHWAGITRPCGAPSAADSAELQPSMQSPAPVDVFEETDATLVDNAGVVLLHPFLPPYFKGLGVASDVELLDSSRALALVHHLATGERHAPEHRLTVAKVLCGIPLVEPVEADVGLIDVECDEATAVLDAAIRHWGALGGTSPAALRAEFLTRPGLLTAETDDDWLLRVEARSVDILLDQLPWSLTYVRLPWMGRMLRVEWH